MLNMLKFISISEKANHSLYGNEMAVTMDSLYTLERVAVCGFARIDGDMVVQDVNNPADSPLFLLKVKPKHFMNYYIVTDGNKYMPIRGIKHLKLDVTVTKGHPLSEMDQVLIKEAIRYYALAF